MSDDDSFFKWRDDPPKPKERFRPPVMDFTLEQRQEYGAKGGKATGKTKRRGPRIHYQALYALRKEPSKGGLDHLRRYWYRKRLEKVAKLDAYIPLDVD